MAELSGLAPGVKVRVEQSIALRDRVWQHAVEGVVSKVWHEPTGSWYAHGKDGRLWLARIEIAKADGELTLISLDDRSRVIVLDAPAGDATA
jgi:hypothetical protein